MSVARVPRAESKSDRTRRRILTAAKQLFDRRGYRDTTVDDITTKAQVAHGTFYLYFKDKRQVLQELLQTTMDEFRRIASAEPLHSAEISALIRESLQTYQRNRLLMRLLREVSAVDPYFREHYEEMFTGVLVGHLRRSIEHIQALAAPNTRLVDARVAARVIVGMVESFAYGMFIGGEDYELDDAVDTLTRFCAAAIGVGD